MKNQKAASSLSHQGKWRRIIEAQQASGQTVAAYCREQRIGQASFYAWKRRLRESPASVVGLQPARADFVELTPATESGAVSPTGIEIVIGKRHVRVLPGFNHELLGEVIQVLEDLA